MGFFSRLFSNGSVDPPEDLSDAVQFIGDLMHIKDGFLLMSSASPAGTLKVNVSLGNRAYLCMGSISGLAQFIQQKESEVRQQKITYEESDKAITEYTKETNNQLIARLFGEYRPQNWRFEELWDTDCLCQSTEDYHDMEINTVIPTREYDENYKRKVLSALANQIRQTYPNAQVNFQSGLLSINYH